MIIFLALIKNSSSDWMKAQNKEKNLTPLLLITDPHCLEFRKSYAHRVLIWLDMVFTFRNFPTFLRSGPGAC